MNQIPSKHTFEEGEIRHIVGNLVIILKRPSTKTCGAFLRTQCDHMWLIETCLSERRERKRRISKETANTDVAFYLLGR